jgi:hypothetical protein
VNTAIVLGALALLAVATLGGVAWASQRRRPRLAGRVRPSPVHGVTRTRPAPIETHPSHRGSSRSSRSHGSGRVRIRSGPVAAGPAGAARVRTRSLSRRRVTTTNVEAEGCAFCGYRIAPGDAVARCPVGHTHHHDCLSTGMGGACALPHCPHGPGRRS